MGWGLLAAPQLLEVRGLPSEVGAEGVLLSVRFDSAGRAASGTFRATLNGADVTDRLLVAGNGAEGSLHVLLEGENELIISVYGEGFWPRYVWIEERHVHRIHYRPPIGWNRG